ncbi:LuxR C-terminal-related transcriptional regulator [Lysobacter terrae]
MAANLSLQQVIAARRNDRKAKTFANTSEIWDDLPCDRAKTDGAGMPTRVVSLLQRCDGSASDSVLPEGSQRWPVVRELFGARYGEPPWRYRLSPTLVVTGDTTTSERLLRIVGSAEEDAHMTAVSNFSEACEAMNCLAYAMAVIDVDVADGLELVARMRRNHQQMPVLAIASHDRGDIAMATLHAGASGYVLKQREDVELILAIRSIQRGGTPVDPSVVRSILSLLQKPAGPGAKCEDVRLSARELQVLRLLARGFSNRDIAQLIALSRLTVEGYIKSLYRKLGVGSRTAAVFEAQRLRLLP